MKMGEIVGRLSYNCDVLFRVTGFHPDGTVELCGLDYRLSVSAKESDLVPVRADALKRLRLGFISEIDAKIRKILDKRRESADKRPADNRLGKILHIDADERYQKMCADYYGKLALPAKSFLIPEDKQTQAVAAMLKEHLPDILIITGHDALYDRNGKDKMENYRVSGYFCRTVREARCFNPSKDSLVIIAGACQSNYEALIEAGANIAASPERVLIHALDPVFAAEAIASTSIDKVLSMEEILENTITGRKGLGGYQTRGLMRQGIS